MIFKGLSLKQIKPTFLEGKVKIKKKALQTLTYFA